MPALRRASSLQRQLRPTGALLLLLLLCAHLLWQSLGQVHRTVHAPGLAGVHAHQHHEGHSHSDDGDHAEHDHHSHSVAAGVVALFSSHSDGDANNNGSAECRLIDQCGHADGLHAVPVLSLPVLLSSFALHVFTGQVTARWAALFDARGPPIFR